MAQETGFTVWLTGMLGAGKTTLASYIEARLRQVGRKVEVLDEDDLQDALWKEIEGATKDERMVIAKRLGHVAELLSRNGVATLVACSSPDKAARDENRRLIPNYIEVYVDAPTDELIKRDTTGKYKKALSGEIPNFVGITEPYQEGKNEEIKLNTHLESVEECGLKIFQTLLNLSYMTPEELKVITGTKMKPLPMPKKGAKPAKGGKPAKAPKAAAAPKKAAAKPAPKKKGKK